MSNKSIASVSSLCVLESSIVSEPVQWANLDRKVKSEYLKKAEKYRKMLFEACNGSRPLPTTKVGVSLMKDCVTVTYLGSDKKKATVKNANQIAKALYDFDIGNHGTAICK